MEQVSWYILALSLFAYTVFIFAVAPFLLLHGVVSKGLNALDARDDPVPEYVQLPQSNNSASEVNARKDQGNDAAAHFFEVLHIRLEADVDNHVDHRKQENTKVPHAIGTSGRNRAPFGADVVVRRRGTPDAEDQQVGWDNERSVVTDWDGLLHRKVFGKRGALSLAPFTRGRRDGDP